jgi:hypothetical protein
LLPGSISKYCLQNSPIPVIVVRPNAQRAKGKRKRQADPTRQQYRDLLDKSGSDEHFRDISQEALDLTEDEAAAVAAAIGIEVQKEQAQPRQSPLAQVQSADDPTVIRIDNAVSDAIAVENAVEASKT